MDNNRQHRVPIVIMSISGYGMLAMVGLLVLIPCVSHTVTAASTLFHLVAATNQTIGTDCLLANVGNINVATCAVHCVTRSTCTTFEVEGPQTVTDAVFTCRLGSCLRLGELFYFTPLSLT